MSTIPLTQLVQINPGVLAAAGANNSLNGLLLSQDDATPLGTVAPYASAEDVGNFYGFDSPEYAAALVYFQGYNNATKTPGTLLIAQYNQADAPAYLRGGKLGLTLQQLQQLSGTLVITANGTAETSSAINLSAATSFSSAASLIEAAFTLPTFSVTYDAQRGAFLVTTTSTGPDATIIDASGTLAAGLNLTSATGAVTQQGAAAADVPTFMAELLQVNQNWALFTTTWEPDTAGKTAFSAWTSLQNDLYGYVGWDSDPQAKVSGSTTTWGAAVQLNEYGGSVPLFGALAHAAFVLSYAACLDFTRTNGRTTAAFRTQDGLAPSVDNGTDAQNLLANGYNFYGIYANAQEQFNLLYNGSVSGEYKWLDSYLNQIWIRQNLQLSMINLLMSAGSIPYNTQGYSLIDAAAQDPINAAVNFGAIRAGVTLSASQAQQVNQAVGGDATSSIQAKGYYLQVQDASAAVRQARGTPPITLYYTDGESVQQIAMPAIAIQ